MGPVDVVVVVDAGEDDKVLDRILVSLEVSAFVAGVLVLVTTCPLRILIPGQNLPVLVLSTLRHGARFATDSSDPVIVQHSPLFVQ